MAQTDAARDRALAAEAELLARYDAALALPSIAADSALKAKLASIRAEHAAHAAAIRDGYAASPAPAASPSPSFPGPPDPKSTIAALAKAEQDAASARTADILAAEGTTAMLLASVSASESGHAALLLGSAG
ncbi:MAG: hypothetical protein JF587_04510 [Catenulisporales bacterium]|jgi:hypothetical protein|nr:hypothetical protein [Catenulisporales bacterium]